MRHTTATILMLALIGGCASQFDTDGLEFNETPTEIERPDPNPTPNPEPQVQPDVMPPGEICDSIDPCGGNLEGTFLLDEACADTFSRDSPIAMDCPETNIASTAVISGQVTYQSNGTWQEQLRLNVSQSIKIPLFCLQAQQSCDDFTCDDRNNAETCRETFRAQSATCFVNNPAEVCDCDVQINIEQESVGTFTTEGSRLTQTFDDPGQVFAGDFCLQDGLLEFEADSGQRTRLIRR